MTAGAARTLPLRPSSWSLAALGAPGLELSPGNAYEARRTVEYRLPAGAHEGNGLWFELRLRFRIAFRRVPARAVGAVAGSTTEVAVDANGDTIASILFTAVRRNGGIAFRRSSLGLLSGRQSVVTQTLVQEVGFDNFFTYHGVRPGLNRLVFRVQTPIGGLVRSVRFLAGSGIVIRNAGPVDYRVVLADDRASIARGGAMKVTATVDRRTGAAPSSATFTASGTAGVHVSGRTSVTVPWRGGAPSVTFTFVGDRTGRWPVLVRVNAGGASRASSTVVRVTAARTTSAWWWVGAACAAVAIAAAAAATLKRR